MFPEEVWGYSSAGRAPALQAGGSTVRSRLSPPVAKVILEPMITNMGL